MPSTFVSDPTQYGLSNVKTTHSANSMVSLPTSSTEQRFQPPTLQDGSSRIDPSLHRSTSGGSATLSPIQKQELAAWTSHPRRSSYTGPVASKSENLYSSNESRYGGIDSVIHHSPVHTFTTSSPTIHYTSMRTQSDSLIHKHSQSTGYMPHSQELSVPYSSTTAFQSSTEPRASEAAFAAAVTQGLAAAGADPYSYSSMSAVDMNAAYGYPVFGGDEYNSNAFALSDDFTAWLFNENQGAAGYSPTNHVSGYSDGPGAQIQGPYFSQSPTSSNSFNMSMQHPMRVTSLIDSSPSSQYIMSEEKRQELLDLMQNQFVERPHDAVKKRKDSVFEGNIDSEGHILSLRMMHTYIGSYWYHQHAQLPILHKPTFSADKTPNLLLLAVIAIGAATLDKAYGTGLTDSAAEFANFVAWHIRWEIVRDADFRPPAKLWVFQTLLLIEVYEKMYATRALHERAHIHHDSTLTLMRRGSSLLGRCASDSPPSLLEEKNGKSTLDATTKGEESWHRWIATEATRRAAFAAFVIDSIHATMFGHSAKMVAHEMRLPLPCDEGLWSAVSPAEASRVQMSLQTNGVKPTMFLDGLKKTLNGQRVRTNSFGRTILMAGLLSVSWHMTQRDIQVSSLGPRTASSFGGPEKWKGVLLRAFDNWKRDFDEALAESTPAPSSPMRSGQAPVIHPFLRPLDDENIFESRTVLHHLAHIAAHVDVVDCQIFAGANRLLGRSITPKDYSQIREKIERWATKASARDAAFYALKFIAQVLIPPGSADGVGNRFYGHASPILPQAYEQNQYIARDDFLLNRPWVLYISALVVWCYGYALEGPIDPPPTEDEFQTYQQKEKDMNDYLDRVAGVRAPDDLEHIKGKNRCLGLLLILKDSFASTRWELTHEASGLLGNACRKLQGSNEIDPGSLSAIMKPKTALRAS